jgi:cytochrome c553
MKRVLRWVAYVLAGLVLLLVLAYATIYVLSARALARTYQTPDTSVTVLAGPSAIAEGKRLATIRGCNGCHRMNLEGEVFFDQPSIARIIAPNLSRLLPAYSDVELERVIRHGVARDGRPVVVMPSSMFTGLSDTDLGAIIAYLRTVPPVDHELPAQRIGPMARLGIVLGKYHTEPSVIDHTARHPTAAPTTDRLAWGKYLAETSCRECHGLDLRGDPDGGTPSLAMAAAYSDSAFRQFFRTGKALGGRELKLMSDMVRERFSNFTDPEVGALHAYLTTLAKPQP